MSELPIPIAKIEDDEIVIRLPIAAIPFAASVAFVECNYDLDDDGEPKMEVSDAVVFAPYLATALSQESEDGTTPVHKLLDQMIVEACERGAEGVTDRA